jgi:hypothetical protein
MLLQPPSLPPFRRVFFGARERLTRIGTGAPGGKGSGLCFARDLLTTRFPDARLGDFVVEVPTLTILGTDVFDRFISHNRLEPTIDAGLADSRLALAFQKAEFPPEVVGDLRALVAEVRTPLAVRSSSLLEDALERPFAGVYETKMIPNDQPDADGRFRRLIEAIKFVWASTFFGAAREYRLRTGHSNADEKMAVIVQEVVGRRHLDRFYPDLSAVLRTWNYYAFGTRPEDGVAVLALGLGKTIVDGGLAWSYSPRRPRARPPFGSPRDLLRWTQQEFWAVHMGRPRAYDPTAETEYLVKGTLADAEFDGTLRLAASTYDAASDRIVPGIGRDGPRAVTFAPLLELDAVRLNDAVLQLLRVCEEANGGAVEIELAVTFDERAVPAGRIGFLQVRPMTVPSEVVEVPQEDLAGPQVVVASSAALGNGSIAGLRDVVHVRRDTFEPRLTREVAAQVAAINHRRVAEGSPYVLIGFGRWGSADPWLGIPVNWGEISGARVIVEAQIGAMTPDPSQGSHFFHNLSSFGVCYLSVPAGGSLDWSWLEAQAPADETALVRHLRLATPLTVKVDGRTGRGVILKP